MTRKTRMGSKTLMFTNKLVRELYQSEGVGEWRDAACSHLTVKTTPIGYSNFYYNNCSDGNKKIIGSVYKVSVEKAREIVNNIDENYEEFLETPVPSRHDLFNDFETNGYYPRANTVEANGTNEILLLENQSLKEKLKELTDENHELDRKYGELCKIFNNYLREVKRMTKLVITLTGGEDEA